MPSELLILLVTFAFGGAVIGIFWRRHFLWLLALCAGLGFAVALVMRDWSNFDFSAIAANARAGGASWVSWCVWLFVEFLYSAIPSAIGGAVGFMIRKMRDVYVGE